MLRSLFSGLSGVNIHQTRLDVIGSNLANINTIAYKESRTTFHDSLYETLQGASGTANPIQVGTGASVAAIDVLHRQGAIQPTGEPFDVAIEGSGMFVLSDGASLLYSRNGSFTVDRNGGLVWSGSSLKVQGWAATSGVIQTSGTPGDLAVPLNTIFPAQATTEMTLVGNLDANDGVYAAGPPPTGGYRMMSIDVFDSLGIAHTVDVEFTKTAVDTWAWAAEVAGTSVGSGSVTFDASGALVPGAMPSISIVLTTGAATPLLVDLDVSKITQYGGDYTAAIVAQNGFSSGAIEDVAVSSTGVLTARLSNGQNVDLGQIALANFANLRGLSRVANGAFVSSAASGSPLFGTPGVGSYGSVTARALEQSSVDLTRQFVDMIVTQRGFQASARVIATANQILQEVVNIGGG